MRRQYKLTPEARADLRAIWELVAQDNVSAAERLRSRFEKAFRMLAQFPRTGHQRVDVHASEPVLFWPVGAYVIVYLAEFKPLVVLRVFHGARDLNALL